MPTVKIPLFSPVYRNVDGEELKDNSREHIDCYLDEMGHVVKRPGLGLIHDLGTNKAIDAMFWWSAKGCVLAVSDNLVYKITNSGGTLSSTMITTHVPGTASLPVFTVGVDANISSPTTYCIIAAGGTMIESHGTGVLTSNFSVISDVDAPTSVTHVDFIDNYLIATNGNSLFYFSDVSNPTSWSASSFATAMRNPDNIQALKVFRRQVFLIGNESTEIWESDGSPFAPNPGGYIDAGTIAKHSVISTPEGIYWLDNRRHFVRFNNELEKISTPFDREIAKYADVSDCVGMRVEMRGRPFVLFQFPSEGVTLAYSVLDNNWSEFRYYDSSLGEYSDFIAKSYAYSPTWGMHLMGSRKDSRIFLLDSDYKTDDGDEIRYKILTGHIDYGTSKNKLSKELRIRAKRGEGYEGREGKLRLRYNDNNRGWSSEIEVSLGKIGDEELQIRLYPRGVFRTRQYEIVVTDGVGVSLGSADEDIEILGN